MADNDKPIIVIRKKKGGHGGHHGGAWKVAYADFVTALMALFIVLWLLNAAPKVKEAVAGYFNDPAGTGKLSGSNMSGTGSGVEVSKDDMGQLKDKLAAAMKEAPNFAKMKDQVEMTVTGEGLRIELLEGEKAMFFESGRPVPTANGRELLTRLAEELGKLPNRLVIEGHTDSQPYSNGGHYTNWELSADRANQARELMQSAGLRADQVTQVRGFADQSLRKPAEPLAASNRRVSVIVHYQTPPPGAADAKGEGGEKKGEAAKGGHGEEKKGEAAKGGHAEEKKPGDAKAAHEPEKKPAPAPANAKPPETAKKPAAKPAH
jgi:chemotaxis protein MotB